MKSFLVRFTLLFAAVVLLSGPALAEQKHHFADLHVFHPVATSPDPETDTTLRFGLVYARSHTTKLLDLTAGVGINSGDMRGLQFVGLYGRTDGEFSGFSMTGGLSHLRGSGSGIQATMGANYVEGSFSGLQMSGLMNYTSGAFSGAQVSSVMNINDGPGSFLQLSSVTNVNAGPFSGLQISSILNSANDVMSGFQIAALNFAENITGAQVGFINLSRRFSGLQIGAVNINREFSGTPIGLVNHAEGGRREWIFYGGNVSMLNVGYRTVVNRWTSVLSAGYGDVQGDIDATLFFGWNFGLVLAQTARWDLALDLGFLHYIPEASDDPTLNDKLHYGIQGRVTADYHIKESWGLFAGVGIHTVYDEYSTNAESVTDPLFQGGVVLY